MMTWWRYVGIKDLFFLSLSLVYLTERPLQRLKIEASFRLYLAKGDEVEHDSYKHIKIY